MVYFLDRTDYHLEEQRMKIDRRLNGAEYILERFPFNVVGHVERISLVLFLVGNEKSLRGQQLISIVHVHDKESKKKKCMCVRV